MGTDDWYERLNRPRVDPDDAYRAYRSSNFENRFKHLWNPLLVLNRAQAIALREAGILAASECRDVLSEIDRLEATVDTDEFSEYAEYEGPYFFFESRIIDALGQEVGGKIHTGRSRNDLFSAAYRVAFREELLAVIDTLVWLRGILLEKAEGATDIVMPAFTHSQPAQPITFAHYLLGLDSLLERDLERLVRSFELTNRSPLGAAVIGGTGFPVDRRRLAELAGFSEPIDNTYDAISSADYVLQTASDVAILMTTISRVSQDFLIWSMFELQFVRLSDSLSSPSSIMPQKRNPAVLEKTRKAASDAHGCLINSLVALESTPYGDVMELFYAAEPFLGEAAAAIEILELFAMVVADLEVNQQHAYRDAVESFCTMTELADVLVREGGISFRLAHEVTSVLTRRVIESGRHAGEITLSDLDRATEDVVDERGLLSEETLTGALDPATNVERRDVAGGTSPDQNRRGIEAQRTSLERQREWVTNTVDALLDARQERRSASS